MSVRKYMIVRNQRLNDVAMEILMGVFMFNYVF